MKIPLTFFLGFLSVQTVFCQQWQEESVSERGRLQYYAGAIGSSNNLGFSVRTNSGGGWAWQLVDYGNSSYFHVQYPNGYVGLGTISPISKLHVNSSIERETLRIYKEGNTVNYLSIWQGTGAAALDPIGTGKLYLGYDQDTDVYMGLNGGKIGIGTTDPRGKLDVDGSGDIFLCDDVNYGTNQSVFLPGHLYLSPYNGSNISYLQARRYDNSGTTSLRIRTYNNGSLTEAMDIEGNGNVGIGTTSPTEKLTVNGTIYGKEVKVDLNVPAPDYVFKKDYDLASLEEVQAHIDQHGHLPEVPSAKAMEEEGINIAEMNMLLLKKIEELTLHLIRLEEENVRRDVLIQELQRKNR